MKFSPGPTDRITMLVKLRPPLIFSKADANLFIETLDAVLQEDAAQPGR